MKFISQVSAALISLGLLTAASAEDAVKFNVPGVSTPASTPAAPAAPATTPAAAPVAAPATVKFTEAQLLEAFGYIYVLQTRMGAQVDALEFTPADKEAMVRGISLALNGKELPYDPKQIQGQLQEFMAHKQEAFMTKLRMKNLSDNLAFFTKLKENKNIVELPSGLRYEILKPATGAVPKPGQLATIHYTGTLINGQVFDSSVERGQPIDLPVVMATPTSPSGVIPGMFEGLQKIGIGGKAKLYIPPSLAYGDEGNQGIPPGAALVFEIEVLGVKDAPKDAPAPAAK
ncbi:FKBP-type peptidyl-prolyl cis-trans isomerase [Opitutus sp. GAS368]|jgi:FKBP-type peptidyl-prolyl cis-trans isomerase|uniref:FKBP-type peptidyl-prolyl cis-trans isomerase n=1 Tax=Opitutus sp. GAS368 TaxID=1882749 RepID=UPI00087DD5BF|nr:FKBP-type peptidyl-prolyl cis-trans isomerase [Opitutus sp. GAS368]SDS23918.1 FKBP-type peptidyl-prolyl cis-trans isomerase FkpA/FKBP-type peptidyl-prolyl cis-trans isomerase FklB [Opitutus sp. GAS368]